MALFDFLLGEVTRSLTEQWRLRYAPLSFKFLRYVTKVDPFHPSVEHLAVRPNQGQNQVGMDVVAVLVLCGHGQQIPVTVGGMRRASVVPHDGPDHFRPLRIGKVVVRVSRKNDMG